MIRKGKDFLNNLREHLQTGSEHAGPSLRECLHTGSECAGLRSRAPLGTPVPPREVLLGRMAPQTPEGGCHTHNLKGTCIHGCLPERNRSALTQRHVRRCAPRGKGHMSRLCGGVSAVLGRAECREQESMLGRRTWPHPRQQEETARWEREGPEDQGGDSAGHAFVIQLKSVFSYVWYKINLKILCGSEHY